MQSAVEDLPQELDGIATEVVIQFPWGSLLRGVAGGDEKLMGNVRRICVPEAHLRITIAFDLERDRQEWARLGLPPLSLDYIKTVLATRYFDAGFKIVAGTRTRSPTWLACKLPGRSDCEEARAVQ